MAHAAAHRLSTDVPAVRALDGGVHEATEAIADRERKHGGSAAERRRLDGHRRTLTDRTACAT
ncbi:MAG: hypothetical protein WEB13_10785 [Dehalococcoidia bacterium]